MKEHARNRKRQFRKAALSASLVAAMSVSLAPTTYAFAVSGEDDEINRKSTIRVCTADERNYIETVLNPMSDPNVSDGSANGAPSDSQEAWLTEGTKEYKVAKEVYEFWTKEIGTSGAFAAGVLANIKQESGSTFDPRILEGMGRFPSARATDGPGGPGGGLYQFTPYSKFVNSPHFAVEGWDSAAMQSRFVWDSEFVTGSVNAGMKNAPNLYGIEAPFTRAYTSIPSDRTGKPTVILDPNALVTTTDPARASKGFQVGYERPAQYHPEREPDAIKANKVFNKGNFKGDRKKLAEAIGRIGTAAGAANAIDTIGQFASGALDPNEARFDSQVLFASPCRLPDGTIIRGLDDARAYAKHMCGGGTAYTFGGSDSESSSQGIAAGAEGDKLLNRDKMQPDAIALADAIIAKFPEVQQIGGWRPHDAYPDHPSGNSLDVMMPHGASGQDKALGDKIEKFTWDNAAKYRVTYTIWQQRYTDTTSSNVMEDRGDPTQNHFDHVHITTNMYEEKGVTPPEGVSGKVGGGASTTDGSTSADATSATGLDMQCGSGGGASDSLDVAEGDVIIPTDGTITDLYGARSNRNHSGIDIANDMGTPIYAAASGTVTEAGPADGYGNWIRIKHSDGTTSEYGHQTKNHVKKGDKVKVGEHIADMGSLGFSTGPHLHLTMWDKNMQKIDPGDWFKKNGVDFPQQIGAQVKSGSGKKTDTKGDKKEDSKKDDD